MENAIFILGRIKSALGTIQITSTRSNLDTLLGCMQLCDRVIDELRTAQNAQETKEGESNGEQN